MSKVILHLCADTGSDTKPYQDDPAYDVRLIGSDIGVENYTEPERPEYDNCKHEYYLDGYISRCRKCQEICQTCSHTLSFDICEECGAYDYIG